jgi:signal peptidase II
MKNVGRSRLLLLSAAVVILLIDQLSKAWISANLSEYVTVQIASWLQPILSITPIRNTGGIFGLFPQLGRIFQYLSLFVVLGIFFYQKAIPSSQYWIHLALGLVTGGAVGNVIDRILRGYVIDFFDVNFWPLHEWPLFNIADSAIVVGVSVMLVDAMFNKQQYGQADD